MIKLLDEIVNKSSYDILDKSQTNVFAQSLECPVDWKKSEVKIDPFGFDTMKTRSEFFKADESIESINDKISSTGLSAFYSGFFNADINVQISNRISKSVMEKNSKGTLFIQCFITNKNVRYFKKLVLDSKKLESFSH